MSEVEVTYGPLEPIPGEFHEVVEMPPLATMAHRSTTLIVERRPVIGRRRYETWRDERGRFMGRWTWERWADA